MTNGWPIVAPAEVTSDWLMTDSWLTHDWLFTGSLLAYDPCSTTFCTSISSQAWVEDAPKVLGHASILAPETPVLNWVHCTELSITCWAKKLRVAVMRWRPPVYRHDCPRFQYPPFCFAPFSSMVYCQIFHLLAAGEGYRDHQKHSFPQTTSGLAEYPT